MKKRIFGTLLMGAFLVASMSTFVSCKDYDDDISKHTTDITTLQTQLTALQNELNTTKAEAAAAKTEAANAKSDAAAALAAAKTETANNLEKAIEELEAVINGKVSKAEYEAKIKEIQDQIAAIDVNLLTPEWKADVEARLNTLEGALAICQKQLESQGKVLQVLVDGLLNDDAAKARLIKAIGEVDVNDIDEATLEALKNKMQTVSDVVDEIAPEGNIITLFADRSLKSLVFKPATYYWGIEASVIQRLTLKPYVKNSNNVWSYKELIEYIDNDTEREEVVGDPTWPLRVKEFTDNYAHVNVNRDDEHDRYSTGAPLSVMFDAVAEYHVNPTSAKIPDNSTINIISNNTSYTRAKGGAVVSLLGEASKKDGLWSVDRGILSVPLDVQGTVSTVEAEIDNANSYVTMFATQVSTEDTTVTSDYACIVEEKVKEIRLTHVPYVKTAANRRTIEDFIQTGLLNTHCGQCAYYKLINEPMGMHLFATVGEAKDFVVRSHTGQDLVNYKSDINLSDLVETHYTTFNDEHLIFSGSVFNRNFEYKFELTDFRITAGNRTNESAHAAIFKDANGKYWLHPQDPQDGGLNGKPYNAAKATEVVIDRVPLVRVSLIYKATGDVVEYGYLPIKITGSNPVTKPSAHTTYTSEKDSKITRYNECYTEGGSSINVITTDWRQTEEDLMSHKVFTEGELGRALSREEFEQHYKAETAAPLNVLTNLQQYYLTNEAAYLADRENVTPEFAKVDDTSANYKLWSIGEIAYIQGAIGTGGLGTSILTWNMTDEEVKAVCQQAWSPVVRAIKLVSDDTGTYPNLYVIFVSGKFEIDNKEVVADMDLTAHIIKEYWYTAGNAPFQQGTVEIHTNVITPEEADQSKMGDPAFDGWKPLVFENQLRYVFEQNFGGGDFTTWMKFSGQSSSPSQPFKATNVKLGVFFDDSANGIYKGYTEAGAAKEFYVKNMNGTLTTATDKTKKHLYARLNSALDIPASYQLVATINDNGWDGTTADAAKLKQLKVSLNNDDATNAYAKALLNYVDHELIGEPNVLKATVAVVPINQLASATDVPYEIKKKNDKEYIVSAVKNGDTYCLLYLVNYKFDVRFLRPVSIANLDSKVIEDATSGVDVPQIIPLSELIMGYTDFRGSITAPNWKPVPSGGTLDYEEYYAPLGTDKFIVHVQDLSAGDYLSSNANVLTNLNQSDPNTFVPLKSVSSDIIFQMKTDDEIEYRNAGSTVQEFKIKIPVQVEYFWGTIYDNVTVTIKKTQANARRK
jgi:outer membrane murein-binding lipoprotein Lpp